ncbi:phosphatidate cytidylyltransferase [Leucobacter sp. BZR 635]
MSGGGRRGEIRAHLDSTRAQLEATNARIEKKAGRNLFLAIGVGLLLAAVFVGSLLFWEPVFAWFIAILAGVAVVELATAFRVAGRRVPRIGVAIGGVSMVAAAYFYGAEGLLLSLFAASAMLTIWRLIEGATARTPVEPRTLIRDIFSGLFTLVYVPFLGSFAILLRSAPNGEWWVFALVLIAVSVDIGAYAAGVTLGKHKMTPRISPNKTWEGFAGAAVAAMVAGVVISITALDQPWWIGLIFGVLVLLTATGGDLTESLIKRDLNVKDMSNWIPGHGGLLDRLDSLLPSTVVAYGLALILGVLS